MAFDFSKGTPTATPSRFKKTSALGKVGEFLAPTTTGIARGLKEGEKPSGRQLLGSALEIGSFAIPAGAIGRGFGLLGRGVKTAATAIKGAKAVKQTSELAKLTTGLKTIGRVGKRQAISGSQIGGVAGAMAGTGRALGEEDKTITQALGEGVTGGAIGALGGGLITPAVGLTVRGTKTVAGKLSQGVRQTMQILRPSERTKAINDLTKSMHKSFVSDNPSVISRFEKIIFRAGQKGKDLDEMSLLRDIAEEGYVPRVDGSVARFRGALTDISARQKKLGDGVQRIADRIQGKNTKLSQIQSVVETKLANRLDVDIAKASTQGKRVFGALKTEFGTNITPGDLNKIRLKMGRQTKAFGKEFVQDVQNAIKEATRERLSQFTPKIQQLLDESHKLFRVRDTVQILNNKKIDPGFLVKGMGSFVGTVAASAGGFSIAGPGGLVLAGIASQGGARVLANMVRQFRFNPALQRVIKQGLRRDAKLLTKLLADADPIDRALIQRAAGKAPGIARGVKKTK